MTLTSLTPRSAPSRTEVESDPLRILAVAESEEEARYIFAHEPRAFWAYFLDIELEWFQVEFIRAAEKYHRLMGKWPAGFGKSTNMSFGYPIWHVARNPNIRIIQLGKTTEEMVKAEARKLEAAAEAEIERDAPPAPAAPPAGPAPAPKP